MVFSLTSGSAASLYIFIDPVIYLLQGLFTSSMFWCICKWAQWPFHRNRNKDPHKRNYAGPSNLVNKQVCVKLHFHAKSVFVYLFSDVQSAGSPHPAGQGAGAALPVQNPGHWQHRCKSHLYTSCHTHCVILYCVLKCLNPLSISLFPLSEHSHHLLFAYCLLQKGKITFINCFLLIEFAHCLFLFVASNGQDDGPGPSADYNLPGSGRHGDPRPQRRYRGRRSGQWTHNYLHQSSKSDRIGYIKEVNGWN